MPAESSAPPAAPSLRLERFEWRDWSAAGPGWRLRAARIAGQGLRLQGGAGVGVLAVGVGELECQGLEAVCQPVRLAGLGAVWPDTATDRPTDDPGGPAGAKATAPTPGHEPPEPPDASWQLDALAGLGGLVHAFITDAVWRVDAEVRVPIEAGSVDFDQVSVAHIGPDSSMGLSRAGLYVDGPGGREYLYLWTGGDIPGAQYEARDGLRHRRGRLDLRAFVEGLLRRGAPSVPGRPAPRHLAATLDRTRLTAELQLGDGVLRTPFGAAVLHGQAQGMNKLIVSATALRHKVLVRLPQGALRQAQGRFAGQAWRCAAVSADLSLRWARPGPGQAAECVVTGGHVKLQDLTWPAAAPGASAVAAS